MKLKLRERAAGLLKKVPQRLKAHLPNAYPKKMSWRTFTNLNTAGKALMAAQLLFPRHHLAARLLMHGAITLLHHIPNRSLTEKEVVPMKQKKNKDEEGYHGWKNRQTWLVHVWLTSDELTEKDARFIASNPRQPGLLPEQVLHQYIDEMCTELENLNNGLACDLIRSSLSEVDWQALVEAFSKEG